MAILNPAAFFDSGLTQLDPAVTPAETVAFTIADRAVLAYVNTGGRSSSANMLSRPSAKPAGIPVIPIHGTDSAVAAWKE